MRIVPFIAQKKNTVKLYKLGIRLSEFFALKGRKLDLPPWIIIEFKLWLGSSQPGDPGGA
jgi:hypothetical protein